MGRIEQIDGGFVDWIKGDQMGDVVRIVLECVGQVLLDADGLWIALHTDSGEAKDDCATASEAVAWVQAQDVAWRGL